MNPGGRAWSSGPGRGCIGGRGRIGIARDAAPALVIHPAHRLEVVAGEVEVIARGRVRAVHLRAGGGVGPLSVWKCYSPCSLGAFTTVGTGVVQSCIRSLNLEPARAPVLHAVSRAASGD